MLLIAISSPFLTQAICRIWTTSDSHTWITWLLHSKFKICLLSKRRRSSITSSHWPIVTRQPPSSRWSEPLYSIEPLFKKLWEMKRIELNLAQKVELIKRHERDISSFRKLAKEYQISKTQASTILKRKSEILREYETNTNCKKQRLSSSHEENISSPWLSL